MLRIPKALLRQVPLFLLPVLLCGQSQPGEIRIQVQDSSGLAMEASGKLESPASKTDLSFQTDSQGTYTFSNLSPGRYRLEVSKAGFAAQSVLIDVVSGTPVLRTVMMALATQAARIDVVANTPLPGTDLPIDEIAAPVQFDGTGVRVAVLDSGIDYTHSKLGGSGLVADYTACYATNTTIGDCPFFPNAKVVGGFDFVGELWDGSASSPPLAPDPDPIALAGSGFHGTHVADIIAGLESTQGAGDKGVAPGTSLYAVNSNIYVHARAHHPDPATTACRTSSRASDFAGRS